MKNFRYNRFIKAAPPKQAIIKRGETAIKRKEYMENQILNHNDFEIVKLERKDGVFRREDGTELPYKTYYVYIRNINNPLIIKAKIEKVFNDYVENPDL
jgi:hypothetical protein